MKRKEAAYASPGTLDAASHLSKLVRRARMARGWSRAELAQRAKSSTATMARLEGGGVEVALGTWLSALEVLGLLGHITQIQDSVSDSILKQTQTKHPVRPSTKDLEF